MKGPSLRSVFVGLVVSMMLMGTVAPMAAAATTPNATADATQNPYIEADVTKATHSMEEFGGDETGALTYYDDNGDAQTLSAELDPDADNPISYYPSHVSVSDYSAFPRSSEDVSAVDAANWSSTSTAGSAAVSDVEVGAAEAVNVDADLTSGDTATFTFDSFTIDSDENKRMFTLGGEVNELGSSATVEVRAVDADGDYKTLSASSGADVAQDSVWADATGPSFVTEARMGDLNTTANGDGNFNNIESVEVVVNDGNFDGSLSLINLEKMSAYDFGSQMVDTDDDGEVDSEEPVSSTNGAVSVTSLDTLGETFNTAEISDVMFTAHFTAEAAPDEDVQVNFTDAENYQTYDHIATQNTRLSLATAYDLSYSNAKLMGDVPLPEQRYLSANYALGIGDTEFSAIEDDDWTANTIDMYSGTSDIELATGIQPGETVIVQTELLITGDEKAQMTAEAGSGGGFFGGSGDGPIQKYILSPIGGLVAAIAGFLGMKRSGA